MHYCWARCVLGRHNGCGCRGPSRKSILQGNPGLIPGHVIGFQHKGIGTEIMKLAAKVAAEHGIEWLHVDYEPHLDSFYKGCGYQKTEAGLLNLQKKQSEAGFSELTE